MWWVQLIGYNMFWSGEFEIIENVGDNIPVSEEFLFTNPLERYQIKFEERLSLTDKGDETQPIYTVPAGETHFIPVPATGYYAVYTTFADGSPSRLDDRDWACCDQECDIYGWGPPDDAWGYAYHEMASFIVDTAPAGSTPSLFISEVMANALDEDTGEYIELYNFGDSDVDAAGLKFSDGDKEDTIEGYEGGATIITPGGYGLILDPEYTDEYEIPEDATLLAPTNSDLGNRLSTQDPITLLTAEGGIIDSYSYPFDPGNGYSAEKVIVTGDDSPDNWTGSPCVNSPGTDNCASYSSFPLVMSEVMANAVTEHTGEFVEFVNLGSYDINATAFRLYDGDSYDDIKAYYGAPTTVPPGGTGVVLDRDFAGEYTIPESAIILTTGNKTLGNGLSTNDPVYILTWDDREVDTYASPFNPGDGISVEKIDLLEPDSPDNWMQSPCGATPGDINCASGDIPIDVVLGEVMANPLNEKTGGFLELYNAGDRAYNCQTFIITDGDSEDGLKSYRGSSVMLEPGTYGIILDRSFRDDFVIPEGVITLTTYDYALGNKLSVADPIAIMNWNLEILDTYLYPFNPGNGFSAEKVDILGGDYPENWVTSPSPTGSTPGLPYGSSLP